MSDKYVVEKTEESGVSPWWTVWVDTEPVTFRKERIARIVCRALNFYDSFASIQRMAKRLAGELAGIIEEKP